MINIEFPYDFGEHVYYVASDKMGYCVYPEEGCILSYSLYKNNEIKANFKKNNGIPIIFISKDKEYIKKEVERLNKQNRNNFSNIDGDW